MYVLSFKNFVNNCFIDIIKSTVNQNFKEDYAIIKPTRLKLYTFRHVDVQMYIAMHMHLLC